METIDNRKNKLTMCKKGWQKMNSMQQKAPHILEEAMKLITETSKRQKKSFADENYLLYLCCAEPEAQPREIAEKYNRVYPSSGMTGDRVIRVFKMCKIDYIPERIRLMKTVFSMSAEFIKLLREERMPKEGELNQFRAELNRSIQGRRLLLICVAEQCEEIKSCQPVYEEARRMNKDFAGECIDGILDVIEARCSRKKEKNDRPALSAEKYEEEIFRLTAALNRSNNLLTRLQESFEEQLAESRVEEQIHLITMLNSEKYGYLLDLIESAYSGFRKLRSKRITIPFEIKDVQTLVRRLLEFVEDCNIEKMAHVGDRLTVSAAQISEYIYDGTPFLHDGDVKTVEVISPGWKSIDGDIVISYPRVKEVKED